MSAKGKGKVFGCDETAVSPEYVGGCLNLYTFKLRELKKSIFTGGEGQFAIC